MEQEEMGAGIDTDRFAIILLELYEERSPLHQPSSQLSLFRQGEKVYFGHIQIPYPENPQIVLFSKASEPITAELAASLKRLRPNILSLEVDALVEFQERNYFLTRNGNALLALTPYEERFCRENPLLVKEI